MHHIVGDRGQRLTEIDHAERCAGGQRIELVEAGTEHPVPAAARRGDRPGPVGNEDTHRPAAILARLSFDNIAHKLKYADALGRDAVGALD
jgi:hypothetical protein